MGGTTDLDAGARANRDARSGASSAGLGPKNTPSIAPIRQLAIAYPCLAVLWFVCMMAASPAFEFLGALIFLMFGPIFVMGAGLALGLPLRLNRRVSRWWLGNWRVYILIAAAGAVLLIAGFNVQERQVGVIDGILFDVTTPHSGPLTAGCFLLTFLAVNASFPSQLTAGAAKATRHRD